MGTSFSRLVHKPVYASRQCLCKPLKFKAKVYPRLDRLEVSPWLTKTRHESVYLQGAYSPSVFSSCAWNEYCALRGRALVETPRPNRGVVSDFCGFVRKFHRMLFPGIHKRKAVSLDVYLKASNASPAVKAAIQRAGAKLQSLGITQDSILDSEFLRKASTRKAFVKVENNLYNTPVGIKDKAPRLIQGARPEFIALVGPAFYSIQSAIKECWSTNFMACFTSSVTAVQIGEYLNVPGQVFENDVSSWDASICTQLCELEVWLAKRFGAQRAVVDLMIANIKTHGRTTHGLTYSVNGTRKSGDPYTSCMNSVLNGLLHIYCFWKAGISVDTLRKSLRMCVQGDDNIMVYPKWMKPRFNLLLDLGFKSDNLYRKSLLEAEFCSNRFYVHDGGYVLGPKIGRVLSKFGHFSDLPVHLDVLGVLRGVAMGYKHCASYVPGLGQLMNQVINDTSGHLEIFPKIYDFKVEYVEVSVSKEKRIINYYRDLCYYKLDTSGLKMPRFGQLLSHWKFEVLFDRDTDGPKALFC